MISRQLAPVERTAEISLEEIGEALALTYWAYYSSEAIQPRVLTAMTRAWGLTQAVLFPRDGVHPGFIVTMTQHRDYKVMKVAIEGSTSWDQISPLLELFAIGSIGSVGMRVYSFFKAEADHIWDRIDANGTCQAWMAPLSTRYTFTGHSLGAACADILAFRWKSSYSHKPARLIKFGSPRVGNTLYVNRTTNLPPSKNMYMGRDPVHQFPSASIMSLGVINVLGAVTRSNACSEDYRSVMSRNGEPIYSIPVANNQSCGHFLDLAELRRGFTFDNPWYDHLLNTYRLGMMNLANRQNDLLKYRFNYLEWNDENAWQSRFSPNPSWAQMNADPRLLPVAPDEVEPISSQVATQILEVGASGSGDWQEQMVAADESPVVNRQTMPTLPPPIPTSLEPRRRFARPRPS